MRIFNTVQELWSYCLFCPICQEPSRNIILTVGPDNEFVITEFEKKGSELKLFCSYRQGNLSKKDKSRAPTHSATFTIDCLKNSYQVETAGLDPAIVATAKEAYFYLYINANCTGCDNSYLNSSDLEFYSEDKTIHNIQMEREGAYVSSGKDKFHITLSHDSGVMRVSRCYDMDGETIDDEKVIELPLVNLDFSDAPKVINKVKTLILFS